MYKLLTENGTAMDHLTEDVVNKILITFPDNVIKQNEDIIVMKRIIIKYSNPNKASTFLHPGFKLIKA